MWIEGILNGYKYSAKVYDIPSDMGINRGRVSKLTIKDAAGRMVAHYDRGWKREIHPDEDSQSSTESRHRLNPA